MTKNQNIKMMANYHNRNEHGADGSHDDETDSNDSHEIYTADDHTDQYDNHTKYQT